LATTGVDVSQPTSVDSFKCLKANGLTFAVVRAGQSNGKVDTNSAGTVANAWSAGLAHVDVYIFPCPSCGNAAGQINNMINFLSQHQTKYGMIWLDIEGPQYWSTNQANNRNFFNDLVNALKAHGVKIGVYTSNSQWSPIMGNWNGGSSFPLWYAHYDGVPNFNDFSPFGGWSKPSIKQYQGDVSLCGAGIDKNWYP